MYSLHLSCPADETETVSVGLWEAGTCGIREEDRGDRVELIATFEDTIDRDFLSTAFSPHSPTWEREEDTDWVAATQEAWPARMIGSRIFLAPIWNNDATPTGRVRVIHNPGLASGTGEHPCTQLAVESLECHIGAGKVVIDIGTGSGILSVAALRLGALGAVGLDLDGASVQCAKNTFCLNAFPPAVVLGSADCVASEVADVVLANISGTVLLSIADELMRILRPGGCLILTGFPESELSTLQKTFGDGAVTERSEWRCLTLTF